VGFVKGQFKSMLMVFPARYETARPASMFSKVFLHLVLILQHNKQN